MGTLKRFPRPRPDEGPADERSALGGPEPAPSQPQPDPAPGRSPLPQRWGRDLGAPRDESQLVVLASRRRRSSWVELPDLIVSPRVLIRSGLFGRDSPTELAKGERRRVPNGWSMIRGAPLSWWDLRTLLVLINQAAAQPRRPAEVTMPPSRLLRAIGQSASRRALDRARVSLERLSSARVAFELSPQGPIGSETEPVRLVIDEGEHVYRLNGWLEEIADSSPASGEPRLYWPLIQRMQKGALLHYMLLEAEDWRRARPEADPVDRGGERVGLLGPIILADPLYTLLDLDRLKGEHSKIRTVRRALRQITSRDLRYRAFKLISSPPSGPPQLYVWRQQRSPAHELAYLKHLCKRCLRPDPNSICCCERPASHRCHDPSCPRCHEEDMA